jgi:hypothetical protein
MDDRTRFERVVLPSLTLRFAVGLVLLVVAIVIIALVCNGGHGCEVEGVGLR